MLFPALAAVPSCSSYFPKLREPLLLPSLREQVHSSVPTWGGEGVARVARGAAIYVYCFALPRIRCIAAPLWGCFLRRAGASSLPLAYLERVAPHYYTMFFLFPSGVRAEGRSDSLVSPA